MTIFTFPPGLLKPAKFTWNLQANSQVFRSPLNGRQQAISLPGARWIATAEWPNLSPAQWRPFNVLLAQLRGASGQLYVGPFHAENPQFPVTGSPVVAAAGQTGASLATSGWTRNGAVLAVGDYFSFPTSMGQELKLVVTSPGVADGNGDATLTFEPPIRTAPNGGAPLTIVNPTCIMGLTDDKQGQGSFSAPFIGAFTLSFEERF